MRRLGLLIGLLLTTTLSYAGDFHAADEKHKVTYVITDATGNPVSGQSVGLAIESMDGAYYDFADGSWKNSGWTTRTALMSYNTTDGFYWRVVSIDTGGILSADLCAIVSNDDATYGDTQTECFTLSSIGKLIRIHR